MLKKGNWLTGFKWSIFAGEILYKSADKFIRVSNNSNFSSAIHQIKPRPYFWSDRKWAGNKLVPCWEHFILFDPHTSRLAWNDLLFRLTKNPSSAVYRAGLTIRQTSQSDKKDKKRPTEAKNEGKGAYDSQMKAIGPKIFCFAKNSMPTRVFIRPWQSNPASLWVLIEFYFSEVSNPLWIRHNTCFLTTRTNRLSINSKTESSEQRWPGM